jgi:hypothetical protein
VDKHDSTYRKNPIINEAHGKNKLALPPRSTMANLIAMSWGSGARCSGQAHLEVCLLAWDGTGTEVYILGGDITYLRLMRRMGVEFGTECLCFCGVDMATGRPMCTCGYETVRKRIQLPGCVHVRC